MKSRSSARGEPRRFGNVALLALMLCSLVALSLIRARFSPIGNTAVAETIKVEDPKPVVVSKPAATAEAGDGADEAAAVSVEEDKEEEAQPKDEEIQPKTEQALDATVRPAKAAVAVDASKPVCYETSRRSDTCEAAGDVRLLGRSQTIYVDTLEREWKTRPYCRKHDTYALSHVKEWSLKPFPSGDGAAPKCTSNSSATAFVISTGGFTGNPFHDYTDVLIPAFITAHRFAGEVQFLVSSYKSWWMSRYIQIFQQMSRYEVVDIDADDEVVPYGRLEWLARNTFAEPSAGMEVHYLEYVVQLDETTLSEQYPSDHLVLKDPMAIHKQGWDALKTTYLDKQNVRPHLGRLKKTFLQALKMLPHGRDD
ncbi:hypothetical protein ACQJBY_068004 [Aegilops geniculata]